MRKKTVGDKLCFLIHPVFFLFYFIMCQKPMIRVSCIIFFWPLFCYVREKPSFEVFKLGRGGYCILSRRDVIMGRKSHSFFTIFMMRFVSKRLFT